MGVQDLSIHDYCDQATSLRDYDSDCLNYRISSRNVWQSGHLHPTGTVCCLRCGSWTRIYVLYICRRRVRAFGEEATQSFGQRGLLHIRTNPCATGTIYFWVALLPPAFMGFLRTGFNKTVADPGAVMDREQVEEDRMDEKNVGDEILFEKKGDKNGSF